VVVLAGAYVVAVRRRGAERWRVACFLAGCALLLVTTLTPLHALTFHLLSAHLLQNVVLAEWAPALLVAGVPPWLAERLAAVRPVRALTRPVVALPVWLATYYLWHLPPAYDAALRHPSSLLHLEHLLYLAGGALFWWAVFQERPWRLGDGGRAAYVFGAFVLAAPLGLLLALIPEPVYSWYEDGGGLWGLSPLTDQQIAGVTMASEEALVFFVVFTVFFLRFLAAEERAEEEPA
jgi:cytochrome c oxidase assembly factor CtaG